MSNQAQNLNTVPPERYLVAPVRQDVKESAGPTLKELWDRQRKAVTKALEERNRRPSVIRLQRAQESVKEAINLTRSVVPFMDRRTESVPVRITHTTKELCARVKHAPGLKLVEEEEKVRSVPNWDPQDGLAKLQQIRQQDVQLAAWAASVIWWRTNDRIFLELTSEYEARKAYHLNDAMLDSALKEIGFPKVRVIGF